MDYLGQLQKKKPIAPDSSHVPLSEIDVLRAEVARLRQEVAYLKMIDCGNMLRGTKE